MHSELFSIGALTIHWYGVMMALGFFLGLWNWVLVGRRDGRTFNFCSDLLFWIMLSGILGARVAYVLAEWEHFSANPVEIFWIHRGGLIYYGGFIGSGIAIFLFAKHHKQKLVALLDFALTAVPLAHAMGRIGCFMNGCCYGKICELPIGVRFPAQSAVWRDHVYSGEILRFTKASLPVHPVQIYEALFNLALYAVVIWHYRSRKRNGSTIALYLLAYPVGRFFLEFFRGDDRVRWWGLSVAQVVSIFLFTVGLFFLFWSRKAGALCDSRQTQKAPEVESTSG